MFWFKSKKVIIDCYTWNQMLIDEYSIKRAIKHTPSWWQDLPPAVYMKTDNFKSVSPTTKKCPGFIDLYTRSWMIPSWSDMLITTTEIGEVACSFPSESYLPGSIPHPTFQFKGGFKDYIHLKLRSPWICIDRNRTNTKFAYVGATWSLLDDVKHFNVLPGVLDFTYNMGSHLNIFLPKMDAEYSIRAGTPLVHLIPLTDEKVEFKNHRVSKLELGSLEEKYSPRNYNKFFKGA